MTASCSSTQTKPGSEMVETTFGPHVMLDCRQGNLEKMSDQRFIYDVLDKLPTAIGMTKLFPPYVFPYEGLVPEDKGITGVVVIAESHLTFHSFTDKDYFFFDIFSCKPFDTQQAIDYIMEAFEVKDVEIHQVNRGRHFPRPADQLSSYGEEPELMIPDALPAELALAGAR